MKKMLVMSSTDSRCIIGTKIETKAVHVTSLVECSRRYRANNKPELLLALSLRCKLVQMRLHWVGAKLLLSKNSTLVEKT